MAAVTDSNDVSDIFWPGYVDAIANLAINLLFVIAIMAIVVIAATLQVQELLKRKDRALASDVAYVVLDQKDTQRGSGASEARSSTNAESSAMQRFAGGNSDRTSEQPNSALGERKSSAGASEQRTTTEPVTSTAVAPVQTRLQETLEARASAEEIRKEQEAKIRQQAEEIRKLQEKVTASQTQLEQARATASRASAATGQSPRDASGPDGDDSDAGRVETVTASKPTTAPSGRNVASAVQSGVVVNFARDVTQLADAEKKDLVTKMTSFAALNTTNRWRVLVVTPKGFSEAARLAFYRANAVRNVLLQEGVPGSLIELRVVESDQPTADSARVIVKAGAATP
jgi:hypothetical protein